MSTSNNKQECVMNGLCASNSELASNILFKAYDLSYLQVLLCLLISSCVLRQRYTMLCEKNINKKNKNKINGLGKLVFYTVDSF